jgi:predicted phosphodiesterase
MIALLSDVHSNLEALQAVWADLTARGVQRVIFLGDIVGYGPDPVAVVRFLKRFEFSLLGNHDRAVLHKDWERFNLQAKKAAIWTRRQLDPDEVRWKLFHHAEYAERKELWGYLSGLKPMRVLGDLMMVHDTPAAPGSDRYVIKWEDAEAAFAAQPNYKGFFVGHSHSPVIFYEDSGRETPEPGRKYSLDRRCIVNVGAVGQPRDGDPRASYVVLDADGFRFFRVEYDIEAVVKKINAVPDLDPVLGERLRKGN